MKPSEATRIVAMVQGAWPRAVFSDTTLQVYATMLQDLDFEITTAAVTKLVKTSRWVPTIAEIRETVGELTHPRPTPEQAWGEVRQAIGRVGAYLLPVFADPDTQAAVEILGWRNICSDDNEASTRARFIDAYRGLSQRTAERIAVGEHEMAPPFPKIEPGEAAGFLEFGTRVLADRPGLVSALPAGNDNSLACAALAKLTDLDNMRTKR